MSPWFSIAVAAVAALSPVAAGKPAKEPPVQQTVRTSNECLPPEWERELWPRPDTVTFEATTLEEREVFSRVVSALLSEATSAETAGAPPVALVRDAGSVGFLLEAWKTPRDTFWVLRERPERRRGAGAYIVRTGKASHDFIQTPHAYFDSGTGSLGAQLFACPPAGARPRLFATNTAHRFRGRPGEKREDPDHPADVAHNPDHLFQLVTDVAARRLANLRVFQLHGFARSSESRRELVAVISDGSRRPSPTIRKLSGRLGALLGTGVRLFPDETDLLGATQNAQARLLQSYPGTTFVHLELSPEARKSLAAATELGRLGDALLAPFEG